MPTETRQDLSAAQQLLAWLNGHGDAPDLRGAALSWADLFGANLSEANLFGANLCEANLFRADLCEVNLSGANLRGANLRGANLRGANLCEANLFGADLCEVNLSGANLSGANLSRASGVLCLPVGHPQGYRPLAVRHGDRWIIYAGCHRFGVDEARAHWGSREYVIALALTRLVRTGVPGSIQTALSVTNI
jgi:hypothetical protein